MGEPTQLQKARNTSVLLNSVWLTAAKEALQGDLGKLRKLVAMSDGKTREQMLKDMGRCLTKDPRP